MSNQLLRIINKIFCHHTKENWNHCIKINLLGKSIFICSRCLGLYPFALIWLVINLKFKIKFSYNFEKNFILYLLFPAFIEWALSGLKVIKSSNKVRFFSGLIASFALSRWWFLWIEQYFLNIFFTVAKIYIIAIVVVFSLILWIRGYSTS